MATPSSLATQFADARTACLPSRRPESNAAGSVATSRRPPGVVVVFNTHLDHRRASANRLAAASELRGLLGALGDRPALLCGDFNAPPDSPTYRAVTDFARDAWPLASDAPGWTQPSREPRSRIDYVFFANKKDARLRPLRAATWAHRSVGPFARAGRFPDRLGVGPRRRGQAHLGVVRLQRHRKKARPGAGTGDAEAVGRVVHGAMGSRRQSAGRLG